MNRSSRRKGRNFERGGLGEPTDLLRHVCLWLLVGITVATPLVTSEAAVMKGTGIGLILIWLLLAFFWSLSMLAGESRMRVHWLDLLPVILIVLFIISGIATARISNFRMTLNMIWLWGSLVAAFFLFRQLVREQIELRAMMAIMIALATTMASFGLYQVVYDLPRQRAEFQKNPQKMLRAAGIHAPPGSPLRAQFANRVNSREPFATFALTNSLAGLLAPWLVVLAAFLLSDFQTKGQPAERVRLWVARRTVGVILLVLMFACLLLTKSRSALLAVAAGMALYAVWSGHRRWLSWKVLVPSGLVVGVLLVVGYLIKGLDFQLLTQAGLSLTYRLQYWRSTMSMIGDRWLVGCGPGNFQSHYMLHKFPESSESVSDPHNFLLEIWALVGTLGLLVALGLVVYWIRLMKRADAVSPSEDQAGDSRPVRQFGHWTTYAGAAFGVFLAYPCGGIAGLTPSSSLLLFIPVAVLAVWVLHPWVVAGELPRHWILIGWATLSINLLAAGGISFAGVAISWWMLLAFGLNHRFNSQIDVSRTVGWGAMLASVVTLAFFTQNSLYPIWNANNHVFLGDHFSSLGRKTSAQQSYRLAAQSDPYSPHPWLRLSALAAQNLSDKSNKSQLRAFREATTNLLLLDPQSPSSHRICGDLNLLVFRATKKREFLELARKCYEGAQRRYPSDAMTTATVAWSLHLLGDVAGAVEQAGRALTLDERNPHQERKLSRQRLADPQLRGGGNAEQQMKKLRSSPE